MRSELISNFISNKITMYKFQVFLSAFLLILGSSAQDASTCTYVDPTSGSVFTLLEFSQFGWYTVLDPSTLDAYTLYFSVCTPQVETCNDNDDVFAIYSDGDGDCYQVATGDETYSLVNTGNPNEGVVVSYGPNIDQGTSYQVNVILYCNESETIGASPTFNWTLNTFDYWEKIVFNVSTSTILGCPVKSSQIDENGHKIGRDSHEISGEYLSKEQEI